ncbi:hypothetical protein QUF58_04225 [Anaerolineales bacterium HSG24]|nr:hypothetical protein [Anaerolineales bacterium HSG24]
MSNNQYDKLRTWLDDLVDNEYRDIIRGFLSSEEQTRLPKPLDFIDRGAFLGHVKNLKRLEKLENYLIYQYPDRYKSEQEPVKQVEPFINQESTIEAILLPYGPQYHFLDAPAGYGKTALLLELKRRLRTSALCAYISADTYPTFPQLVYALFSVFGLLLPENYNTMSINRLLLELGGQLKQKRQINQSVYILIDLEKLPSSSILKALLTQLIPRLHRNLKDKFRVVIAGRYLANHEVVKNSNLQPHIHQLNLFTYDILLTLVRNYLSDMEDDQERQDISAHIFHLSGGHPGAMVKLLGRYKRINPTPDEFLHDYKSEINIIMTKAIADVRSDIPEKLLNIMDILGPCRRFNYQFLQKFMDLKLLPQDDAYDLADSLIGSYLITTTSGFLQDDITSRLLSIRLRQENPKLFLTICQSARDIYANDLANPTIHRPEIVLLELLFHELQLHYYQHHHGQLVELGQSERQTLAEQFFELLDKHLQLLMKNRDVRHMSRILDETSSKDKHFQFTLNYFLRETSYTERPYNRLREYLKKIKNPICPIRKDS